jgi:hypothetical protein
MTNLASNAELAGTICSAVQDSTREQLAKVAQVVRLIGGELPGQ